MKNILRNTGLALSLLSAAFSAPAYTTPVGYVTETLTPGKFNLIGLTLHESSVYSGVIASADATSITCTGADFSTILTGGTYILECDNGVIQEVTTGTSTGKITTPENISASIVPTSTTFKLRKAATVASVFGATNSAGLTSGTDITKCDKIMIQNASGAFESVFYFNDGAGNQGWLDSQGNLASDKTISYPDAVFVYRVASNPSNLNLVVSGEIKTSSTSGVLTKGFNYMSAVFPGNLTLGQSNIKNSLAQSTSLESSDLVMIQNANGTYTTCYYFNDKAGSEGWLDSQGNLAQDFNLSHGFLIYNKSTASKPFNISSPTL